MNSTIIAQLIQQLSTDEELDKLKLIETLQSLESETPKKTKKSKKMKDPNHPKRPSSAYFIWLGENRDRIKEELGEDVKVQNVVKEAGRQWKLLDDDAKGPFEAKALVDRERYHSEMEVYKPSEPRMLYDVEDYPEAPDGWNGPYQLKYLSKNAKGADGKAKRFKNFDEAVVAANELEGCGGITKTKTGYSLRIGPDLISPSSGKESSSLASWVKGEVSMPMVMEKSGAVSFDEASIDEGEGSTKKTKTKDKKVVVKKTEPEPEPEVDIEESEDEELDVEEFDYEGKTYYKDDNDIIYDPETTKKIGVYENDSIRFYE